MQLFWRFDAQKAAIIALCAACWVLSAQGSVPSAQECEEAGDFIMHAAQSRDAGVTEVAFMIQMRADYESILNFPPDDRWFVHDVSDEAFLIRYARLVWEAPVAPEIARARFVAACHDRMGASDGTVPPPLQHSP